MYRLRRASTSLAWRPAGTAPRDDRWPASASAAFILGSSMGLWLAIAGLVRALF